MTSARVRVDRLEAAFDDPRLVADAGLLLPATGRSLGRFDEGRQGYVERQ